MILKCIIVELELKKYIIILDNFVFIYICKLYQKFRLHYNIVTGVLFHHGNLNIKDNFPL